jgi:hypothetical protein
MRTKKGVWKKGVPKESVWKRGIWKTIDSAGATVAGR